MTGVKRQSVRATAVFIVLALCWPMAIPLAAAATPVRHACCMRAAHGCHSHQPAGDSVQAVCRTCGWCHALPNFPAHVAPILARFSLSLLHAGRAAEVITRPSLSVCRLNSSRAPPAFASLGV